jgi:hypothetical protein
MKSTERMDKKTGRALEKLHKGKSLESISGVNIDIFHCLCVDGEDPWYPGMKSAMMKTLILHPELAVKIFNMILNLENDQIESKKVTTFCDRFQGEFKPPIDMAVKILETLPCKKGKIERIDLWWIQRKISFVERIWSVQLTELRHAMLMTPRPLHSLGLSDKIDGDVDVLERIEEIVLVRSEEDFERVYRSVTDALIESNDPISHLVQNLDTDEDRSVYNSTLQYVRNIMTEKVVIPFVAIYTENLRADSLRRAVELLTG